MITKKNILTQEQAMYKIAKCIQAGTWQAEEGSTEIWIIRELRIMQYSDNLDMPEYKIDGVFDVAICATEEEANRTIVKLYNGIDDSESAVKHTYITVPLSFNFTADVYRDGECLDGAVSLATVFKLIRETEADLYFSFYETKEEYDQVYKEDHSELFDFPILVAEFNDVKPKTHFAANWFGIEED